MKWFLTTIGHWVTCELLKFHQDIRNSFVFFKWVQCLEFLPDKLISAINFVQKFSELWSFFNVTLLNLKKTHFEYLNLLLFVLIGFTKIFHQLKFNVKWRHQEMFALQEVFTWHLVKMHFEVLMLSYCMTVL